MSARCFECQAQSITEERFCTACGRPLHAIDPCGFGASPTLLAACIPDADPPSRITATVPDLGVTEEPPPPRGQSAPLLDTFYDEIESVLAVSADRPRRLAVESQGDPSPQMLDAFYRELDDALAVAPAGQDDVAAGGVTVDAGESPPPDVETETVRGVHEFEENVRIPQPWWAPKPEDRQTPEPSAPPVAPHPAMSAPSPLGLTATDNQRPPAPWPCVRGSAPPPREATHADAGRDGTRATPYSTPGVRRGPSASAPRQSRAWILAAGLLTAAGGGALVTDVWSFWLPRDQFAMRFGSGAPLAPMATAAPSAAGGSAPAALPVRVNPPLMTPAALPAPVHLGTPAPGSKSTTGGARTVAAGTAKARSKPPRPSAASRRAAAHSATPVATAESRVEPTPVPSSNLGASMLAAPAATPALTTGSSLPSRPSPSGTYDVGQVDVRPQVTYRVEPSFPERAAQRGLEDVVILRVLVSHTGAPADLRVLRRSKVDPMFDAAALKALRQWRFAPARKGGQAVNCWLNVGVPVRQPDGDEGSR